MKGLLAFHSHLEAFLFRERPRGLVAGAGFSSFRTPPLVCRALQAHGYILSAVAFELERNFAGGSGEQSMISAHADIAAGVELGAALTHQNVAADDALAAELLHAETPAGRITAVARRTASFLMSHRTCSKTCFRRPKD